MKKLLSHLALFVCLFTNLSLKSQNIKTDIINSLGNSGWEMPSDVVFDSNNNYYFTGTFSGEITIGTQLLKSNGARDIFLAKFDKENNFQWAKSFGSEGDDNAYSLLFTGNNLYLAGCFKKQIRFDNNQLQGDGLTDVFLATFDTQGSIIWAKEVRSKAVAQKAFSQADNTGKIWIASSYTKSVNAGSSNTITGNKKGIYFLSHASTSGEFDMIKYFDTDGDIELNDFIINSSNQIYFAGTFSNTLNISGESVTSLGKKDGFIVKLDINANITWLKNMGGLYDDQIKSISIDTEDNLYVGGEFKNEMTPRQIIKMFF